MPETCAPAACARRERRGDGDCGAAAGAASAAGGGGDNRRLLVRATVNGDGLAGAEARPAGDRDNGRAHGGGGAHRGGAGRADRRDDGGLEVRARINHESSGRRQSPPRWRL